VSNDDKYVSVPLVNRGFSFYGGASTPFFVMDSHNGSIVGQAGSMGVSHFSVSRDKFENGSVPVNGDPFYIGYFRTKERPEVNHPILFNNGYSLIQAKLLGHERGLFKHDIQIVENGRERSLGISGVPCDVSQDGSRMAYFTSELKNPDNKAFERDDLNIFLRICDIDGRNDELVGEIKGRYLSFPSFVNVNHLIFQTNPRGKKFSDVYLYHTHSDSKKWIEQITNNYYYEGFPQEHNGRVYFLLETGEDDDEKVLPIYFMKKDEEGWKTWKSGFKSRGSFRIVGNNLFYYDEGYNAFMRDLRTGSVKNLTATKDATNPRGMFSDYIKYDMSPRKKPKKEERELAPEVDLN
jgi:hypothetical protein